MADSMQQVIRPNDEGYDAARRGFDLHAEQRPALIVAARDASDVVGAVALARAEGRRIAVQATGHGGGPVDPDAVLVTTAGLRDIDVDASAGLARVGAGVTNGELISAAAPFGLAPLSGSHPGVGVVGYTLTGGLPLLGRRYGWAADHLRIVDVVGADGVLRHVELDTPGEDADLAWALPGGGGSFGVVTAVQVELVPVRSVFGGQLVFAGEDAAAAVRAWRDWADAAPDTLGTGVLVGPLPDSAAPPELRGRTAVIVQVAFAGSVSDGAELVAPLRAAHEPVQDTLRELPWTESATIHDEPPGPTATRASSVTLGELPDAAIDAALAPVLTPGPPRAFTLRRLGGALNRGGPAGPVRRDARWLAGTVAIVPPDVPDEWRTAAGRHLLTWRDAVAPWTDGRLAGFLLDEGADPAAVRSAYQPAAYERLQQIKAAIDPDGLILSASPIPLPAR